MAYDNFKPTMWADSILENLDNAHVFGALANKEYEGTISGAGSSVKISEVGNVSVTAYAGTVNYEELDDASKELLIDKKAYAAVSIDDVDNVQSKPKLLSKLSERMAYGMANYIDADIASLYSSAGITVTGTTGSPTNVTSATTISLFSGANRELDEANAPQEGRVAVIPPWLKEKMVLAKIIRDTDNSATVTNGFVGRFLGFDVYVSNNVSHSGTTWYAPMFFIRDMTIGFASQLNKVEALRAESSFEDKMRALTIYGRKVLYPATLAVAYIASAAESTI
jgi:hypothetical protein